MTTQSTQPADMSKSAAGIDALTEALALAEEAIAYVPEYFADKHRMPQRLDELNELRLSRPILAAADSVSEQPSEQALPPLNYGPLYEYALGRGLDYNELCRVVRAARQQPAAQAPAPAPEPYDSRGPTTLEGWRSAALAGEKERDWLRERLKTVERHQGKDCWYWQNDGEDHLESLTSSLPVVIRADHLRDLLKGANPPAPAHATGDTNERRHDGLRPALHGIVALGGCTSGALADLLWASPNVMGLNAELGLTMDQLVRLARTVLTAAQAPAAGEPATQQPAERVPLTDAEIAEGRYRVWANELEDAPEPWAFLQGARFAERAHGIKPATS